MNEKVLNMSKSIGDAVLSKDSSLKIASMIKDCLQEYCDCSCIRPRHLIVRDRFTGQIKDVVVPCGHCEHCRNKKQGEWVSRMILQTQFVSKYCYFITLTYRAFDHLSDVPKVLRNAYYRCDDLNFMHRNCYSPCLLRHEHVQRFMKYLRKIHGNDPILFFQGSEYGSDFGRPHHHLILWSNEPISRNDVVRAWSCRLPHDYHTIHIGRVDYNDLNANGTIVADGINFGNDMSRCFSYVAKYISKSFVDCNDRVDSKSRLNYFIDDLAHFKLSNEDINYVFDNRIRKLTILYSDWAEYFSNYVRDKEYTEKCYAYNCDPNLKESHKIYYDYETSPIYFQNYRDDLVSQTELDSLVGCWHPQINPCVFRKVFKPFCNSSRSAGIGVEYFNRHVTEYCKGNFRLPPFMRKSGTTIVKTNLLFPSFFIRKTKEYLYRYVQKTWTPLHFSPRLELLCNKDVFNAFFPSNWDNPFHPAFNDAKILTCEDLCSPKNISQLINSSYCIIDYRDNTKMLAFCDAAFNIYLNKYKCVRKGSKVSYEFISRIEFQDFCSSLYDSFLSYSAFKDKFDCLADESKYILNEFIDNMSLYIDNVLSDTYDNVLESCYSDYIVKKISIANDRKYKVKRKINDLL